MEKPKIKKDDFVEIEYTARVDGIVFDTTSEEIAKANNILEKDAVYKPIVVCVGLANVVKGVDESLVDKEAGASYSVHIRPDEGFGAKNPKLLQLVSTSKFLKEGILPAPGLQVNIDGIFGIVKTVSGGRTIVDFNHPLAGKELDYDVKVSRIVTDTKEKLESLVKLRLFSKDFSLELTDDFAKITHDLKLSDEMKSLFEEEAKRLIPEVKKLVFEHVEIKNSLK